MSVYVDQERYQFRRMIMGHMIADTLEELHEMAAAIGLRREWFQDSPPSSFPHYDVSLSRRAAAVLKGAINCDRRTFVGHLRRLKEQRRNDLSGQRRVSGENGSAELHPRAAQSAGESSDG